MGVAKNKYAVGLDFDTNFGLYLINTYNYLGSVYADFANTRQVKSFGLLNSKIGYKKSSENGMLMFSWLGIIYQSNQLYFIFRK